MALCVFEMKWERMCTCGDFLGSLGGWGGHAWLVGVYACMRAVLPVLGTLAEAWLLR